MKFNQENKGIVRRISALLMLSCYVLVFFQINLIHHVHHDAEDHHHVHHDEEAEQDACHRAIYHQEQGDGCTHDAHILAQTTGCEFCDSLLSQTDLLEELELYAANETVALVTSNFSQQHQPLYWSNHTPLRGPPSTFS